MNTNVLELLNVQPFEPFEIITSSGERYTVPHPEMVRVTGRGKIYVFRPIPGQGADIYDSPDILSTMHITSLEPIQPTGQTRSEDT